MEDEANEETGEVPVKPSSKSVEESLNNIRLWLQMSSSDTNSTLRTLGSVENDIKTLLDKNLIQSTLSFV